MKIVIIGAGPAGIAAALQLNKFGIYPLVFECGKIGGLLLNAYRVDNYPGEPNGISGVALAKKFANHFLKSNIIIPEKVIEVGYSVGYFRIISDSDEYHSKYLIVATGTKAKKFNSFQIPDNLVPQIHYDISALFEARNKKVLIVGGGDAAFDYALSMAINNSVTILNRANKAKCNKMLFDEVMSNKRIKYYPNAILKNMSSTENAQISVAVDFSGIPYNFKCDDIIFAIGREPNIDFLNKMDCEILAKLIKRKKLFIIGDAVNGPARQTAISVGDGSKAAMEIYFNLKEMIDENFR